MSIATKTGDGGSTGLVGGKRVSKADLRVEAYGTVDELVSTMGFARSICRHAEVVSATKAIQKELFSVAASLASPEPAPEKGERHMAVAMVERLTSQVETIEAMDGVMGDWILPGEHTESAAYDMARTVCRRAERTAVRLRDAGETVDALAITYLNRLSDLLWLFGRLVELQSGVDAKLRDGDDKGPTWSKAW